MSCSHVKGFFANVFEEAKGLLALSAIFNPIDFRRGKSFCQGNQFSFCDRLKLIPGSRIVPLENFQYSLLISR
jgi:hypothetical protein